MGVLSICPDGYVVDVCRCKSSHPVRVVACDHESHANLQHVPTRTRLSVVPVVGAPTQPESEIEAPQHFCSRCQEPAEKLYGSVCAWCMETLEAWG